MKKSYPELDTIFELTLYGDALKKQPQAMAEDYGYGQGWVHVGEMITDITTRQFKLITVSDCPNWNMLLFKLLRVHRQIPAGQWLNAFRVIYPDHDGKGPLGVADASWMDRDEDIRFPYIRIDGTQGFYPSHRPFPINWRWLVFA